MTPPPSAAECVIRALRLLDPELCSSDATAHESERRWLTTALLHRGDVDEERAAADLVANVLSEDEDALDGLFRLAGELVDLREGFPHCVNPDLWHQVGYELDTDVLVAARLCTLPQRPADRSQWVRALAWPSVVTMDDFATEEVLSREIADTHVHLGGALPGSLYWVACMCDFARSSRLGGWSPDRPELWIERVTTAAERRKLLARELVASSPKEARWLGECMSMAPPCPEEEPFCDYLLFFLEPLFDRRRAESPILGERLLVHEMLGTLWRRPDHAARKECLSYLRVRNSFIRHLSHGPGYRGLERFQTTFRRQHLLFDDRVRGDARRGSRKRRALAAALAMERFRVRHALRYQFSDPTDAPWARDHGAGLETGPVPFSPWRPPRQVELRVTPVLGQAQMRVLQAYLQGIHDFVHHERDAPLLRVGLVFHVHRYRNPDKAREVAAWQLEGILAILEDEPRFRPFIVGVDAAGAEMATAPRELSACFRRVEEKVRTQTGLPGLPPIRLGRTCHAGEDFRDLLTGLRYVDETMLLLRLRVGDRIGHGLAAALDPREWYARHRHTHPLFGDHVLDLLWARHLARESTRNLQIEPDPALDAMIVLRLEQVLSTHGDRAAVARFREVTASISDDFADVERFPSERAILGVIGIQQPRRPIEVRVDDSYVQMVQALRRRVLRRLRQTGVVVEACPTSNLLVGGFVSYERLPYLNLNHGRLSTVHGEDPEILLSINSDDPGVFRTTIANEFRLVGRALLRAGHRRREVAAWLDEARSTGVASTFIPRWSPPTRREFSHALSLLHIDVGPQDERAAGPDGELRARRHRR